MRRTLNLFAETTASPNAADVANLRNRLGQQRRDFPSQDEIVEACSRVATVVSKLEDSGFCPVLFWRARTTIEDLGRATVEFTDYRGRIVSIRTPSRFERSGMPKPTGSLLIVPELRVQGSDEVVRFRFSEGSSSVKRWSDFPRRTIRMLEVGAPIQTGAIIGLDSGVL